MSHKRFSFDDEEINELSKDTIEEPLESNEPSINVDSTGDKKVAKKKKKKSKIKKWHIALFIFLSMIIGFVVYVFVAGGNDGPVYGDRCASLIAIDKDKFNDVETTIKNNPSVSEVSIEVDCRIIKISMNFADNTSSKAAKDLATQALHTLDDALGQPKEEGKAYSNLFGNANGRGQYNVEFVLTSNGDTDFPIFGTKHPNSDEISFTGANPVNQETTDQVSKKKVQ